MIELDDHTLRAALSSAGQAAVDAMRGEDDLDTAAHVEARMGRVLRRAGVDGTVTATTIDGRTHVEVELK